MFCWIFHPGDLSLWQLAGIIVVTLLLTALPLVLVGFIIYKVFKNRGAAGEDKPVTLKLN